MQRKCTGILVRTHEQFRVVGFFWSSLHPGPIWITGPNLNPSPKLNGIRPFLHYPNVGTYRQPSPNLNHNPAGLIHLTLTPTLDHPNPYPSTLILTPTLTVFFWPILQDF